MWKILIRHKEVEWTEEEYAAQKDCLHCKASLWKEIIQSSMGTPNKKCDHWKHHDSERPGGSLAVIFSAALLLLLFLFLSTYFTPYELKVSLFFFWGHGKTVCKIISAWGRLVCSIYSSFYCDDCRQCIEEQKINRMKKWDVLIWRNSLKEFVIP